MRYISSHRRWSLTVSLTGLVGGTIALALGMTNPAHAQLTINIHAEAALQGNQPAYNAFTAAAAAWTSRITTNTPVTVTIDADVTNLGANNVLGQTSSTTVYDSYANVRAALASQAVSDPTHDAITASLPTAANFNATVGTGQTFDNTRIFGSLANFKAMGDTTFLVPSNMSTMYDGTITFNSNYNFSYSTTGAVPSGQSDFLTVATHEIGHLLGFYSATDAADTNGAGTTINASPLDLFRFNTSSIQNGTALFATSARNLTPGAAASFWDSATAYNMATGLNKGDGSQASHWKDDGSTTSLNSNYIGIMDPSLPPGLREPITSADLRAFDLIGYTLVSGAAAPEPGSLALMALAAGTFGASVLRRRVCK